MHGRLSKERRGKLKEKVKYWCTKGEAAAEEEMKGYGR